MDWKEILGWAAAASSIVLFVVGFGAQIMYNWKRRSTEGLHPLLVHLSPLSLVLWSIWSYACWLIPPLITNLIGVLFALVILGQYYYYPRKKKE